LFYATEMSRAIVEIKFDLAVFVLERKKSFAEFPPSSAARKLVEARTVAHRNRHTFAGRQNHSPIAGAFQKYLPHP